MRSGATNKMFNPEKDCLEDKQCDNDREGVTLPIQRTELKIYENIITLTGFFIQEDGKNAENLKRRPIPQHPAGDCVGAKIKDPIHTSVCPSAGGCGKAQNSRMSPTTSCRERCKCKCP